MSGIVKLQFRMYLVTFLVFAVGFGVIYALMTLVGAGMLPIAGIAVLFFIMQWYISPKMIAWASHLRYVDEKEFPDLHRNVSELAASAGVPKPRIAISESKEPNAFVFGRTRKSATLVVHRGLLDSLNKNEINAVLAHEIGHIRHNDVVVITFISFVPMLAYIIAQELLFAGIFGGFGKNNSAAYLAIVGIGAFIAYFISELLILALSRARESYADIYSATSTKKPEYLASALVKIMDKGVAVAQNKQQSRKSGSADVTRALYIVDMFSVRRDIRDLKSHMPEIHKLLPDLDVEGLVKKAESTNMHLHLISSLFSTHPSLYRRLVTLATLDEQIR